MPMNPMSPKASLPLAPAFRLLSDLNEFLAHPLEERKAAYVDYVAATEQHQAAVDQIRKDLEISTLDRDAAADTKLISENTAKIVIINAETKAKAIVDAATEQAESVNKTVSENVARSQAESEILATRLKKREETVLGREEACEVREANAFKERETAVQLRERAVEEGEKGVKRMTADAQRVKETYESLIADINALQRRAPR